MQLTDLKGVGPKTEELFHKLGVYTPGDLLYYFPNTYLQFDEPKLIANLQEGEQQAVAGFIDRDASVVNVHGLRLTSVYIHDLSGHMKLTWFNAPFLKHTLTAGHLFIFVGKVSRFNNQLTMSQPKIYKTEEYSRKIGTLEPVYAQTKGLSNQAIVKAVKQAFSFVTPEEDFVPAKLCYNRQLLPLRKAITAIHFPESLEAFSAARRRLAYNELFLFSLALAMKKKNSTQAKSVYRITRPPEMDVFFQKLPFALTKGQANAIKSIEEDLASGFVMNRLVQGDVGSGKTIVAVAAMLETALNGFQAALMAPTEILAEQHYQKISALLKEFQLPLRCILVTGSLTAKEKRLAYEAIQNHEADLIIGTHALFQAQLDYARLALVITDEQHRFGVNQRKELAEKGQRPHTLVMSATPIPRTLAMLLYADMQVSQIRELPANRLPIKNAVVGENYRNNSYKFIYGEIQKGRQAYIICPMVEPNDTIELENVTEYSKKLRSVFPKDVHIACLHGKMKAEEKENIMNQFLHHDIDLLVSTTVVEVGVDVPNATVMMIENAERFGLAQLHQLRGRVGRSGHQSFCIFVDTKNSENSKKRLSILSSSNDGFAIAEEDLKLRGPGDIFGIRQSGVLNFSIADIYQDKDLLASAAEDARYILSQDPNLEENENIELRKKLDEYRSESYTL